MTLMGKILVVLILVLALAQVALHSLAFVTRRNWVKEYDQLAQKYVVAQAESEAYKADMDKAKNDAAVQAQKLQGDIDAAKKEADKQKAEVARLQQQIDTQKTEAAQSAANQNVSVTDVERLKAEADRLEKVHKADADNMTKMVSDNNKLRDQAVAAQIEARSLKERNNNLMTKLEEMSKDLVKARTTGTSSSTLSAKNPPLENIDGLVTKLDPSGLMTLSIGSDAGLVKGNTLEVFRLSPARYLGTVRIISLTPHEAVAQPVGRPLAPIRVGDRVASRILGS
ncbi:MAG TPA: hypothetical protein VJ739_04245 [Gemmataceae bacterium]|nr:hypothetical protein [Gemmataceae bacterium]